MSNSTSNLDQGARVLRDEELDAVSGGNLALAAVLIWGFAEGMLVGGSAQDGFVATMVNKAKDKL